jgi:hypothetical protein
MSREGVSGRVHVVDLDEGGTATGKIRIGLDQGILKGEVSLYR